jgi:hypothetical protein
VPSTIFTRQTDFNREETMRSIVSMTLAACTIAVLSSTAFAQTPAPAPATPPAPPSAGGTPDAMPFDIPYGVSIGLERAKSRLFYNAFETGHGYVATLDPTLVASPGGFPLVEGGKLIGAVGCSGGTGDQDAAVCKVGAEVVK